MKKVFIVLLLQAFVIIGFGQTKIGNNPQNIHPGAIMELESNSKGILVPRIILNDVLLWTLDGNPIEGMLIYNDSGVLVSGFYYWSNEHARWVKILNNVEQLSNTKDNQQIEVFEISGNNLLLELEDGGGEKSVSLLQLLDDIQFTNQLVDSLINHNSFTSEIQNLILNTNTQLTEAEVDAMVSNNGYLTSFTEVDGDISNEGSLTVAAGTSTTSIINSNTSGQTGVTLTAAGINSISETGNVITITATEVDGSTTNEIQDLSLSGNTLSLTGDASSVDVSAATAVAANTAKETNATHTGEVTGAGALTIASNVVDEDNLKISNSPTNGQFLQYKDGTDQLTWAASSGIALTDLSATSPIAYSNTTGVFSVASGFEIPADADMAKLDGIAPGAEVNVQSDWNAASGDALILNKPTIPSGNQVLDWTQASQGTIHATNYVDNVDDADASVTNEGSLTVAAGTSTTSIINSNTSGQTGVTLTAAGINSISETGNVITLTATEVDGSTTNEIQDLSLSGNTLSLTGDGTTVDVSAATSVAANTAKVTNATHTGEVTGAGALAIASNVVDEDNLKISNSPTNGQFLQYKDGTDQLTWAASSGIALTDLSATSPIAYSNTTGVFSVASGFEIPADADMTKLDGIAPGAEVNVQSDWNAASGDALILNKPTIPSGNQVLDWTQASQGTIHATNYVDNVDDADASVTNEGSLTVAAGTSTTSIINSNTSGQTGVTLTAAGINSISETGNVITLTATEVDGSTTNEIQDLSLSGNTLSLTGDGTTVDVSAATSVAANTAKVTNATHTGEVTGAGALAIASNVVDEDNLKISNSPTNGQFLQYKDGTDQLTWAASSGIALTDLSATSPIAYSNTTGVFSVASGFEIPADADMTKLDGIAPGAEVNVQSDWNAASGDALILNKPTIPSGNQVLDWTQASQGTIHATNYVDNVDDADASVTNEGSLTVAAGTSTTSIINSNTSGQTGVTLTAAGINSISETGNVITLTATEVDGSTTNEIQDLSLSGNTLSLTGDGTTVDVSAATSVAANTAKVTNATHTGEVTGAGALAIASNVVDEDNLKISNSPTNGQFLQYKDGTDQLTWAASSGIALTDLSATSPIAYSNTTGVFSVASGFEIPADADMAKLDGIAPGAEVNVQSDWNAASGDALILNKPTIPSGNQVLDWTQASQGTIHATNYVDNVDDADASVTNEGSLTVAAGTSTTSIINSNTSGQTGVTLTAAGINSISETGNVITLTATEVDGSTTNEIQDLSLSGNTLSLTGDASSVDVSAATAVAANTAKVTNATHTGEVTGAGALAIASNVVDEDNLKISNSPTNGQFLQYKDGTDQLTWAASSGIALTDLSATSPIAYSNTTGVFSVASGFEIPADADMTKLDGIAPGAEVNVQSDWNAASGDALILNKPTIPSGNQVLDWTQASQGTIHATNYVDNVDDADASVTNEGSLTVAAGTSTTSIINSNTSGQTGVTLTAAGINSISETGNIITLTATEVDGSTTNEIQDLSLSGNTLSLTGDGTTVDVSAATSVAANTAKVTNATHTGEVTGAGALAIASNVVDEDNLKISNSPTNGQFLQYKDDGQLQAGLP